MLKTDYKNLDDLWMTCNMKIDDVDNSEKGIGRFLARNPDTCFVAEIDNELIGAIMTGNDGMRGYIYNISVHPSCRKHGVGSALVKASVEALKSIGISSVSLAVFEKNLENGTFWEKQGFTLRTDFAYRNKSLIENERI